MQKPTQRQHFEKSSPPKNQVALQQGPKVPADGEVYHQYDVTDYIGYCNNPAEYEEHDRVPDNHDEDRSVEFRSAQFIRMPLPQSLINTVVQTARCPEVILKRLERSITEKVLNLSFCHLKALDIRAYVIPFLRQNLNVQTLETSHNLLTDEAILELVDLGLETLDASSNRLTALAAVGLAKNTSLKALNLNFNDSGDEGAIALAASRTIQTLNLKFNNIGEAGAIALAANHSITNLNVSGNPIEDRGVAAFLHNTVLEHLSICSTKIISDTMTDALLAHETLKSIDLIAFSGKYNPTGEDEETAIQLMLAYSEKVRKIKDQKRKVGFLMGTDPQLGRNSPILRSFVQKSSYDNHLLKKIFSYIKPERLEVKRLS